MLARSATRALFRAAPTARVGLAPRLAPIQRRAASTAAPVHHSPVSNKRQLLSEHRS